MLEAIIKPEKNLANEIAFAFFFALVFPVKCEKTEAKRFSTIDKKKQVKRKFSGITKVLAYFYKL